jgi:TldD protein
MRSTIITDASEVRALGFAALERAKQLGASHAECRLQRLRTGTLRLRDCSVVAASDDEEVGIAVRVIHGGAWGFASSADLTIERATRTAEYAVELASMFAPMRETPLMLADEPIYEDEFWISPYEIDPFSVPVGERAEALAEMSLRLLDDGVAHVDATLIQVLEETFYCDSAGSTIRQQRIRLHPEITAMIENKGREGVAAVKTLAPPCGRGWEYLTGQGWDWDTELAEIPGDLREKAAAPTVRPGRYDLVIHPSNLWLTIHESVGHATEFDRILGHEAAFAGTSFLRPEDIGRFRYGSKLMNIRGDRTARHGLATTGFDHEGVKAQEFDIVRDGVLVGCQMNREIAGLVGSMRSNGCAYADSYRRAPLQRMPNVSLQPAVNGPSLTEIIGDTRRGIFIVGNDSWSIDMQRMNFQFTGQRFYLIRDGRLGGQLRDVAYQATTSDFWRALTVVGGPETFLLAGSIGCGKGQPGQTASVSHGSPAALFRQIDVLNTGRG